MRDGITMYEMSVNTDEAIRDHDYATGRYLEEIHFKRLLADVGVPE